MQPSGFSVEGDGRGAAGPDAERAYQGIGKTTATGFHLGDRCEYFLFVLDQKCVGLSADSNGRALTFCIK